MGYNDMGSRYDRCMSAASEFFDAPFQVGMSANITFDLC